MPIDFSGLVLAPCVAVFGKPVTVYPIASQPYGAPYGAQVIWEQSHAEIPLEGGGVLSASSLNAGVRAADFAVALAQGDWISLVDATQWPQQLLGDYRIDDVKDDSEGGRTLVLKRARLPTSLP